MNKRVFCRWMMMLVLLAASMACRREGTAQAEGPGAGNEAGEKKTHVQYKLERYGDEEFAKEPRLQFAWNLKGEEDSIWSIKLDGSDLQKAVDYKVLEAAGLRNIHEPPRRSWDNRWIAVAGWGGEQRILVLVDLKSGTAKKIKEELGTCWPCWSLDSRKLYFSNFGGLHYYDIASEEIHKVKGKGSAQLYSFPGKDYFLYLKDDGYGRADSNFDNIQEFKLIEFTTSIMAFSPDGRYLLIPESFESRFNLFDLQNNNEQLTIYGHRLATDILVGPQNEWIYYGQYYELHRYNWKTGEDEFVFITDGELMAFFSIINYKGNKQTE